MGRNQPSAFSRLKGIMLLLCLAGFLGMARNVLSQSRLENPPITNLVIMAIEGEGAQIQRAGAAALQPARTGEVMSVGDVLVVKTNSRVTLKATNPVVFRTTGDFAIKAPNPQTGRSVFKLFRKVLNIFHRGPPSKEEFEGKSQSASTLGTEFTVVIERDSESVTVIDGRVQLSGEQPPVILTNLEQRVVSGGNALPIQKITPLQGINIIQWMLYYPGVLDLQELPLEDSVYAALRRSLEAYRLGNLERALLEYPEGRAPESEAEKVYRAALLLTVGQVEEAERLLDSAARAATGPLTVNRRLADALRELIASVKQQPFDKPQAPELATEWVAESYYQQSLARLPQALDAAYSAVAKSQSFGFGWERVAELEFSFGRIDKAKKALATALTLAPENAQAVALNGFLLAAENKIKLAIEEFNKAIALDGGLANGWLGRGLCRIRQGDLAEGRDDLLIAAAIEPQRAFLRSYLGKAFGDAGQLAEATDELRRAKELDPNDPTSWLYSALLNFQNNRVNEAIRELERSQDLTTNRAVYRSSFSLDQDRAVRSANLAHLYRDAGMTEWSLYEAGRAVSFDYANYSSHLFLANSYDALRDPNRISLRYETAAFGEYLIANLIAPVGAGILSQTISQAEYSKLFERNRLGLISTTEYLSRGAWTQSGAQFGIFGNTSYSLEALYRTDPGQRANNDFEERQLGVSVKQQLTPADSIYLTALQYESEGGDRFQYYDPAQASPGLRTKESQEPTVIAGYHHEWHAGSHFLLLGAHFDDTYEASDARWPIYQANLDNGELWRLLQRGEDAAVRTHSIIDSIEAQQLWQGSEHTLILGSRFQWGEFDVDMLRFNLIDDLALDNPPAPPDVSPTFDRFSLYAYELWRPHSSLLLVGGVVYDRLRSPENIRFVPMSGDDETVSRVLPKFGFIWNPLSGTFLRGAYSRSLGGVDLDQSIRLEPTQVAGFNQAFRSIAPESQIGSNSGAEFESFGLSLEQKLREGLYLGLGGTILRSEIFRTDGAVIRNIVGQGDQNQVSFLLGGVQEKIEYREDSFYLSLDQLLGTQWSFGAQYRLARARLENDFPSGRSDFVGPSQDVTSFLHQIDLHAIHNHPSGFFTEFHALLNSQNNRGYSGALPGDSFWHLNLFAGYRFAQRRAEVTVGLLNLTDEDYRLNPLVFYRELPRERTFVAKLQLAF